MTHKLKLVSLLLLASIAVSIDAKKDWHKDRACHEDKKRSSCQQCCKSKCCCKKDCDKNFKCDKSEERELAFKAKLTFEQLVIEIDKGIVGPRPSTQSPGKGKNQVVGTFEICFAKDFSKADYRLIICNVNKFMRNKNENLLGAWLFRGQASDRTDAMVNNNRPIAFLCNLDNRGDDPQEKCGTLKGDICLQGTLTNRDINPERDAGLSRTVCNLAGFYDLVISGDVTVIINGSNICQDGQLNLTPALYGLPLGLLRGQCFSARMTN